MLQFQQIEYTFERGLDTKTDVKSIQPPFALTVENGVYTATKSIKLRNGYTESTSISGGGLACFSFNDDIMLISDREIFAFDEQLLGSSLVHSKQSYVPLMTQTKALEITGNIQHAPWSLVINSNIAMVSWTDAGDNIRVKAIDSDGGTLLASYQAAIGSNFDASSLFAFSDRIGILYRDTSNNKLFFNSTTDALTAFVPSSAIDLGLTVKYYYASYVPSLDKIVFIFQNGSNVIQIAYVDKTGTVTNVTVVDAGAATFGVSHHVAWRNTNNTLQFLVTYIDLNGQPQFRAFDSTFGFQFGFTVDSLGPTYSQVASVFDGTKWAMFWNKVETTYSSAQHLLRGTLIDPLTGSFITEVTIGYDAELYIPPTVINDVLYLGIFRRVINDLSLASYQLLSSQLYGGGNSNYSLLLRSPFTLVRFAIPNVDFGTSKPLYSSLGNNSSLLIYPTISAEFDVPFAGTVSQLPSILLSFMSGAVKLTADALDKSLTVGGVVPLYYDNKVIVESGFDVPEPPALAGHSSGSNNYIYAITFGWSSTNGVPEESEPSANLLVSGVATINGSNPLTIHIIPPQFTVKKNTYINIYRSVDNGTTLYLVDRLFGDENTGPISYTDTLADGNPPPTTPYGTPASGLQANLQLYTTGISSELGNNIVPDGNIVKVQMNRLFIAGNAQFPSRVFFSKTGVPTAFPSEFFEDARPDDGDQVTGLAKMDGNLVIFKQHSIFLLTGNGPADNGTNNDFVLARLASDVGCTDPRSVVEFSQGVLFKGTTGIYWLSRGLQVQYIGAPVEAFNNLDIVSATLYPEMNSVYFATDADIILVYNYFSNAWSVFNQFDVAGAMLFKGSYRHFSSQATLYSENKTGTVSDFNDNGLSIPFRFQSPWLYIDNRLSLKRYKRVALLSSYKNQGTLDINFYYDYIDTIAQSVSFTPAAVGGYGLGNYGLGFYSSTNGILDLRSKMQRQKAESLSIEVLFNNVNEFFQLSGITLEIGSKVGLKQSKVAA